MKYNIFDVVKLKDNNKAIISEVYSSMYKVRISKDNEPIKETKIIDDKDIKDVLYRSNIHRR